MAKALTVKDIAPEKNLEECARKIITTRFYEMVSFKKGVIDGTDIECVHDMRVASRRLRAALRNFADCFTPKKEFHRHLKQVERITSTLGAVRDLDVLIDYFQKDLKTVSEDAQASVQNLTRHLQKERRTRRIPVFTMFQELEKCNFEQKFLEFFQV